MSGQQKIVKGLLLATQRIEKSLGTVSGKIEDNQYQENISLESTVNGLSDQIAQIKETQEISSKKISENQKDLQNLAKIINDQKKVLLKKFSDKSTPFPMKLHYLKLPVKPLLKTLLNFIKIKNMTMP